MSTKSKHLLHLAALALLLYLFAVVARVFGVTAAFVIFLPLGMLVELRFWWTLLMAPRQEQPGQGR